MTVVFVYNFVSIVYFRRNQMYITDLQLYNRKSITQGDKSKTSL